MIHEALARAGRELGLPEVEFAVEHPREEAHGDYSTNVAMVLYGNAQKTQSSEHSPKITQGSELATKVHQYKNPRELAEKIVTVLQNDTQISSLIDTTKISVAGPGFINFWLTDTYLHTVLTSAGDPGYGVGERLVGQRIVVEYTDPNPFKEFHIGHLMSNTIGESIARLIEAQGGDGRAGELPG